VWSSEIIMLHRRAVAHNCVGALKIQDQKMQDWKMTDQRAGVENAGLEKVGLENDGLENAGLQVDGDGLNDSKTEKNNRTECMIRCN